MASSSAYIQDWVQWGLFSNMQNIYCRLSLPNYQENIKLCNKFAFQWAPVYKPGFQFSVSSINFSKSGKRKSIWGLIRNHTSQATRTVHLMCKHGVLQNCNLHTSGTSASMKCRDIFLCGLSFQTCNIDFAYKIGFRDNHPRRGGGGKIPRMPTFKNVFARSRIYISAVLFSLGIVRNSVCRRVNCI